MRFARIWAMKVFHWFETCCLWPAVYLAMYMYMAFCWSLINQSKLVTIFLALPVSWQCPTSIGSPSATQRSKSIDLLKASQNILRDNWNWQTKLQTKSMIFPSIVWSYCVFPRCLNSLLTVVSITTILEKKTDNSEVKRIQ